jgi:pilus assembly protein Flp/PilA
VKLLFVAFRRLARAEAGVTSLEYALIASLIGVVIIGSLTTLGPVMDDKFTTLADAFKPTDDPAGRRQPPPDLVITNPVDYARATADVVEDAGSMRGRAIHTVEGEGRSVTISAADLLAAARGSGLNAKPAAGPADGIQTSQAGRPVTSAKSPDRSTQDPKIISATKRQQGPSSEISDGALDLKIQRPSPNDMTTGNESNFLSGPGRLAFGLFALVAVLLGLAIVIRKVIRRARLYSNRISQLREWRENSGNQQEGDIGEGASQEVTANT